MIEKESDFLPLMTCAGLLGMALINKDKPFMIYEFLAKIKGIPLWIIPEMNLQSYYSPIKEAPIPVYSGGEIIMYEVKDES